MIKLSAVILALALLLTLLPPLSASAEELLSSGTDVLMPSDTDVPEPAGIVEPLPAEGASSAPIAHGECGETVTWELYGDGKMVIHGTGKMTDYDSSAAVPWSQCKAKIYGLTVEEGVTRLGNYSFYGCSNLISVQLPRSLTVIGSRCFGDCTSLDRIKLLDTLNTVSYYAFRGCTSLKAVYLANPDVDLLQEAFGFYIDSAHHSKIIPGLTLYYPSSSTKIPNFIKRTKDAYGDIMSGRTLDIVVDEHGSKYTGKAVKPAVTVLLDGTKLKSTAYSVSYANNVNIGTADVTLSFTDSSLPIGPTKGFRIGYLIDDCSVALTADVYHYRDAAPRAVVTDNGTALELGKDFVVTTVLNDKTYTQTTTTYSYILQSVGTAAVTVEGRGNYVSSKTFTIEVQKYDLANAGMHSPWVDNPDGTRSSSIMHSFNPVEYTGEPITRAFELRYGEYGSDIPASSYVVTYTNNIKPGTATMTATGVGEYTTGKLVKTFSINRPQKDIVTRLSGSSRTATAAAISKKAFDKANCVVIASGDNYADALAGVPLASALNAPILLVQKASGPDAATLGEIKRLGAKEAVILGGAGAVTADAASKLEANGCTVDRIAGASRFETAVLIAEKLEQITGKAPAEAFFVYARNFPDALAVSGVAAAKGAPILYLDSNGVPDEETGAWLTEHSGSAELFIIGGTGAISSTANEKLTPFDRSGLADRLSGKNRFDTCVAINERFSSDFGKEYLCVATGTNFPDALAGGVFCAANKAPLLLVSANVSDVRTAYVKKYDPYHIFVFGGTGAVSDKIADTVASAS